jgi:hypothetical protein
MLPVPFFLVDCLPFLASCSKKRKKGVGLFKKAGAIALKYCI